MSTVQYEQEERLKQAKVTLMFTWAPECRFNSDLCVLSLCTTPWLSVCLSVEIFFLWRCLLSGLHSGGERNFHLWFHQIENTAIVFLNKKKKITGYFCSRINHQKVIIRLCSSPEPLQTTAASFQLIVMVVEGTTVVFRFTLDALIGLVVLAAQKINCTRTSPNETFSSWRDPQIYLLSAGGGDQKRS